MRTKLWLVTAVTVVIALAFRAMADVVVTTLATAATVAVIIVATAATVATAVVTTVATAIAAAARLPIAAALRLAASRLRFAVAKALRLSTLRWKLRPLRSKPLLKLRPRLRLLTLPASSALRWSSVKLASAAKSRRFSDPDAANRGSPCCLTGGGIRKHNQTGLRHDEVRSIFLRSAAYRGIPTRSFARCQTAADIFE